MTSGRPSVNRNHKDRLFRAIFSEKKAALSLFNAVNGTDYTNPDELEIVTLDDAIYMTMKNDLAVCVHDRLSMFEHQSTLTPNMPLRGLMYGAREYESFIARKGLDTAIYGSRLVKLPEPRYYVLYNGARETPDVVHYRLSDAFVRKQGDAYPDYEWTAIAVNINPGHNEDILSKCPDLKGYSVLVGLIRKYKVEGLTDEDAVTDAIDECINRDYLKNFLTKNKTEAMSMILTDFDQEAYEKMIKQESFEDGFNSGIDRGKSQVVSKFISKGHTAAEAADVFDMPIAEVEVLMNMGLDNNRCNGVDFKTRP